MMQFTHPFYLLILPPLIYFTWRLGRASLADMSPGRRKVSFGIRVTILTLLVLAISGVQLVRSSRHLAVIFALDISDSVPTAKRDAAMRYVRDALKNKREGDFAGLVVFGADSSLEFAPDTTARFDSIRSAPQTSYTDIGQALGLAMASFPEDSAKRIVLLSDGNENLGKAMDQATMAESGSVSIDAVPIQNDVSREALLDRMISPSEVKVGEPFELKVIASSKTDAHAQIRIVRNGRPVGTKAVALSPGKNVLAIPQTIDKPGVHSFQAFLASDSDTLTDNNVAQATTIVRGKPKVLYLEGVLGQAESLAKALRSSDIDVVARPSSGVPVSMDELREYDSVILSDVPATAMMPDQMKMLEAGVRDLGVGLGMVGGEDSFGAGGYFNTPVERALPVDMSIRKQKAVPSLSVVVVIDKSGSMGMEEGGRTKISLANEAAVNVVRLLNPIDKAGIIFCHDYPVATVPLTLVTDKGSIARTISTVNAEGGGITCFPSLKMAYAMIHAAGTRQKHVIMLCDGADCDEQNGCIPLASKMNSEKITVTSVAIGDGPHVPFLKAMAAAGGGNYYLARHARELPYIFTKDVMLISKSLIVDEPFRPSVKYDSTVLSGIDWGSAPPLLAYVATSAKPMAEVPLVSHKDDPVFAQWQYGLGKSIAFTSDAKPRWAVRWIGWPGYNKFWAQAVRWSMRKTGKADFQTLVDIDQATGHVTVDAVDDQGRFVNFLKLEGRVVLPDMKAVKLNIVQTAPGRYEAEFTARQIGTYTVNVVDKRGAQSLSQTQSLTVPYPPEYKDIQTNRRLLSQIATTTHGKLGPTPEEVFRPNPRSSRVPIDLWWTLALLAAILFPLDVAVRRLTMGIPEAQAVAVKVIEIARERRKARKRQSSQGVESVGQLLSAKKSRTENVEPQEVVRPQKPVIVKERKPEQPEEVPTAAEPTSGDTTSRLLEAKRRAREQSHDK